VVPLRHSSDGEEDESAMDMVDVTIGPGETQGFPTDAMVYKAHQHDVVGCGVIVNSGSEISIPVH
jgi:hypothetical protein